MRRLGACLLLLVATPASGAGVRVSIDVGDRPPAEFLVVAKAHYPIVHGTQVSLLAERFVPSGVARTVDVGFVNPIFFARVVATVDHPAYVHQGRSSETYPVVLRPSRVPPFEPVAWRDVLDGRAPPPELGPPYLHPENVFAHLRLFADEYLPHLDAAGGEPDPREHLPLFRELVARARAFEIVYPDFVEEHRRTDVQYAHTLELREKKWVADAEAALAEIEVWLTMSSAERRRVQPLRTALRGRRTFVRELMTDDDRAQLSAALESWWQQSRRGEAISAPETWSNRVTGVRYEARYGYPVRAEGADRNAHPTCIHVQLGADLGALAPPELPGLRNGFGFTSCRRSAEDWRTRS